MTESLLNFGVQPAQEAGSLNVMLGAVVFVAARSLSVVVMPTGISSESCGVI